MAEGNDNILEVPDAPGGYSLTGKKIMVHDQSAPLNASTVMVAATSLAGTGTNYAAPMWTVNGNVNMPVAGQLTFISSALVGATEMNYVIVNKMIEFIDEDFTFDNITGTITRLNVWVAGDKMVTPHKPA